MIIGEDSAPLTPLNYTNDPYPCIEVVPYRFRYASKIKSLLALPDHLLIKKVSTSPEVEGPEFVADVRVSLEVVTSCTSSTVFPNLAPLVCRVPAIVLKNSLSVNSSVEDKDAHTSVDHSGIREPIPG